MNKFAEESQYNNSGSPDQVPIRRVAFLTPEYATPEHPSGGLANYLRKTAAMLSARGVEAWIFVASDREASWRDGAVEVREVPSGGVVSRVASGLGLSPSARYFVARWEVARSLAKAVLAVHAASPFDMVQAASYKAPGYALLRNRPFPMVSRISSHSPLLRAAYGGQPTFFDRLSDRMEARQIRLSDGSFAPSELLASVFRRMEGADPEVVRTPIGTPFPDNGSPEGVAPPTPRYFLFVGTLSRIKGADLLAEALPKVLSNHPDLSFVSIGRDDGIPGVGNAFQLIADRCCADVGLRLRRFPELPGGAVASLLRGATALLIPSRIDNCPNVVSEAHAVGIPVIGTRESSIDEMVVDGRTGFLAPNGDAEGLAVAMERCLNRGAAEVAEMRRAIARHIEVVESEDRVGRLLAYYGSIVRSRGGRRG